uniref:YadA-like family protein n=1 Tax=Brackiella oedipodis TaxID=124225 RepID=UPI00057120E0
NGKDGKDGLSIKGAQGPAGVDGKDGENKTRLVYQPATEGAEPETVATLNDGLKFAGDDGQVIAKKLNEQLDIVGGAEGNLTDGNIGVNADENGRLNVQLADNIQLTDKGSLSIGQEGPKLSSHGLNLGENGIVAFGDHGPTLSQGGFDMGNTRITHLAPAEEGSDAVNLDQLKQAAAASATEVKAGTNIVSVDASQAEDGHAIYTVNAKGTKVTSLDKDNLTVTPVEEDGNITNFQIDINRNLDDIDSIQVGERGKDGKDGVDGTIGVNGKDGSAVVLNGKDGSIGLNGKDGENGITIKGEEGPAGVDGKIGDRSSRIVYYAWDDEEPEVVATLHDGLNFAGDDGKIIAKPLNDKLDILGGADLNKLSDNNIGIVADEGGHLNVKLADNIQLSDNGSLQIGTNGPRIDNAGIDMGDKGTLKFGDQGPSISQGGINMGNTKITGLAAGEDPTDAVNVSQLNASTAAAKTEVKAGANVTVDTSKGANGQDVYTVNAKSASVSTGSDKLVVTSSTEGLNTDYQVDLSDEAKQGIDKANNAGINFAGNEGETGPIKLGDTVNLKGTDGNITAKGEAGQIGLSLNDQVTIGGSDEANHPVTVDGKEGAITGLTNTEWTPADRFDDGYDLTQAATQGQLNDLYEVTKNVEPKGWHMTYGAEGTGVYRGATDDVLNVAPDANVTLKAGDNMVISHNGQEVTYSLNKNITVDSVSISDNGPSMSAAGINAGNQQVTNVASGLVDPSGNAVSVFDATGDTLNNAVNVGDLQGAMNGVNTAITSVASGVNSNANAIRSLQGEMDRNDRKLRAGVASAIAAAHIPQAYLPGKSTVGLGTGTYRGESGFAIGASTISENGKWIIKASTSSNTRGDISGGAGVSYQF